jgi:peptide/nickel transport system substrate-binding protein
LRDLPYLPLVHLDTTEIVRKDTWHGWKPSPLPNGRPLFETGQQILALKPGPAPVAAAEGSVPAASTSSDDGWLTTPRSVLIGAALIALAILGSRFIGSSQRRTEPLEWTEE